MAAASLTFSGATALAQDAPAPNTAQPAGANTAAPRLGYGVAQILQLAQAKLSEGTIIAYIKNSGNHYGLNADEIIYLRQQGLSDAVITAMLSQPGAGVASATPAPAPAPSMDAVQASTATVAPSVSYVDTAPATAYYSSPYYYDPYCYYPGYAWYAPVGIGWGWGWGWHGGGYHGGGFRGGWHGGGFGGGHGGGHR